MVSRARGSRIVPALAVLLAVSTAHGQPPALPPAPVPIAPGQPGSAPPDVAPPITVAPPAGTPGPAPSCPAPVPLAPRAFPPPPPGPPPYSTLEDRNGPLLKGDPLLDPACATPGWFADVEIATIAPHIKNRLQGLVPVAGITDTVHVPQAPLDWTAAPRLGVGYRFPEGFGEFLVSYRFFVSEGTDTIPAFDGGGDGFLKSRLNLNVIDLDYGSKEFALGPWWDMKWQLGARIASVYFDSRATGLILEQRTSNNFFGAGPHAVLQVGRHFDLPGLSAFARLEGAVVLGRVGQGYEETFTIPLGPVLGGASTVHSSQAVPVLNLELGLAYVPPNYDHMRLSVGYVLEHWWELGQAGPSSAELNDQGVFFRSEFNF